MFCLVRDSNLRPLATESFRLKDDATTRDKFVYHRKCTKWCFKSDRNYFCSIKYNKYIIKITFLHLHLKQTQDKFFALVSTFEP